MIIEENKISNSNFPQSGAQSPLSRRGFGGGLSFSPSFGRGLGEASLLIANRGEIAVRIIRAAQKMGILAVAVYAADDADSLHVSLADKAVLLPGTILADTYLNQDKIIRIAIETGVDAIHPGYGFLSENAGFAQKVANAGLIFIGPSPENIRLMGEKNQALDYVSSLGIPVLPSFRGTIEEIIGFAPEMNFPMMVKASGGGGGKGMLICNSIDELLPALEKAERQALDYFGNGELFVEKYLPHARHIEVQLLADNYGNVLHFFERECSVQRRFQKIIEEAPSPSIDEKLRLKLTSSAVKIARSMNYRNAGTIEFLLDENGQYYFLEMNTRIQVEHPVTEMITKTDLVELQLMVATGNELSLKQEDIHISGHAIEVRLCAEDAENQFHPSAGKLLLWRIPEREHLRIETFAHEGIAVSANYDSLLAKLIVCSDNREKAISEILQTLSLSCISGIHTNLPFLIGLLESETIKKNKIYTRYVDENLQSINLQIQDKKEQINRHKLAIAYLIFHLRQQNHDQNSVWNRIGFWRINPQYEVSIDGNILKCEIEPNSGGQIFRISQSEYQVAVVQLKAGLLELAMDMQSDLFYCTENELATIVWHKGFSFPVRSNLFMNQVSMIRKKSASKNVFQNLICADLFGKVLNLNVQTGSVVEKGQILLTLESMKTEIHVLCPVDARVKKIHVNAGNSVIEKQLLIELDKENIPS